MVTWDIQFCLLALVYTILALGLVWYVQFLWNRRDLYIYSWNVPGPFAFPLVGAAYLLIGGPREIMNRITKWQRKYPSLVKIWLGPHLMYVVGEPEYIRTILTHPNCMDKNFFYSPIISLIGTGLLTAPAAKWKKHRKILNPSFNQHILDSFVGVFAEQSNILTEQLLRNVGRKNFDLFMLLSRCTLDMIWENAMGIKFNVQTTDNPFATSIDRMMQITILRMFTVWLHPDFIWKLLPLSRELDKHLKICRDVEIPVIQKRMHEFRLKKEANDSSITAEIEKGTKKKNLALLDLILECSDFTEEEIRDEIEVFAIAGSETSASTMCFVLEMLGIFQDVQQKVYEEVIEIVGEDRDVTASDLPNLKYIEMVIKETLRLFPTVPLFLRAHGEDIDLGETILPAGSFTFFNPIEVHRNPKYWPDPLRFDPDRFLPEEAAKRHPGTYFPFSLGARNCIGAKYAMMNIKTMLSTVIRKYKIFTDYKSVEEIKLNSQIVLRMIDGSKVCLEVR